MQPDKPKIYTVGERAGGFTPAIQDTERDVEMVTAPHRAPKRPLYLVSGSTIEGTQTFPYIGVGCGTKRVVEYRIYEDREGWFVDGEFTISEPHGSTKVWEAVERAGREAFLDVLLRDGARWVLKEKAEIK